MDKPRKSIDPPWPAIAAALAALGGVFVISTLQTSRPAERTGLHVRVNHLQDVDARLWQDPLRTTVDHETQMQEQRGADTDVSVEGSLHAVDTLRQTLSSLSSSDWVLAVMIPGGSYAEYSEARLRTRQAVLEALGAENYVPVDGEHIGYFKITRDEFSWFNMIVPFEWCDRSGIQAYAKRPGRVCVVWLPDEEFRDAPLSRLDWLLRDPTALGINTMTVNTRIIGPPTSAILSVMMHEVAEHKERQGWLPKVEMWCATATASDELLLRDIHHPEYQTIEQYFAKQMGSENNESFIFHRCTASDRDIMQTLADELRTKRGLRLNGKENDDDHIALISEWDTFYGRALPVTFEREISTKPLNRLDQLLKGDHPKNILIYHYLRGIDGMLPGTSVADTAKTDEKTQKTDEKKKQSSRAREITEGLNQADYLRRLARELVERNEEFRRQGKSEIKAVGVLGSDVYDKLLVMEALRDALPNAIFFTNQLDARLAHPDEWRWTRNLLVGSPFGLTLREEYQNVPPFRDSNQTAFYTATLLAADNPARADFLKSQDVLRPVRLYEIGRKGAFDLTPPSTNQKTLQPANSDMMRWWNLGRGILTLAIGVFAMAAIAWSVCAILGHPKQNKKLERADSSFARVLGSSWSMFVILGLCSVVFVWTISCYNPFEGEPYSWNDGISIWPTETLRLLAALLSVFYIFRISIALWLSERNFESHFALPKLNESLEKLPFGKGWWSRLIAPVSVRHWKCYRNNTIDAEQLWKCYCDSGAQRTRWLRIGPLIVCYVAAASCLLFLLGAPGVPARGDWARNWDVVFLLLAIFGSVSLTFYVADATLLSRRFIHYLMKNVTTWPAAALANLRGRWSRASVAAEEKVPPNDLLREYLTIDFIARQTDFVGRLIYYPFIVVSLLVISRLGVFDHWTRPVAPLIVWGFNAGYAAFSVGYLRRTAERVRQNSLKRLHDMLISYTAIGGGDGKEAKTIRETTLLIESEDRGAFAPVSQQFPVTALLLPSGSAGIWALLQFFPRLLSG